MGFRNWPSWVKGGVILLIPALIFLFIEVAWGSGEYVFWGLPYFFVIGAIIGWTYGKIKNKNSWPSWLKGGVIALIISLVLLPMLKGISVYFIFFLVFFDGVDFFVKIFAINCIEWSCEPTLATYFIFPIISFLFGAILGQIVGKLKSKKQPQQLNQNLPIQK